MTSTPAIKRGLVQQETMADGTTYSFAYTFDATNSYITGTTVTDPLGHTQVYAFNSAGFTTSDSQATDTAAPRTTSFTLDAVSNTVLSKTDPGGLVTSYCYDTSISTYNYTTPCPSAGVAPSGTGNLTSVEKGSK